MSMVTEDDVLQITQWVQQRRDRVAAAQDVVDVKDPMFGALAEDAEMCDILLDLLDQFRASDLCVTALGLEEGSEEEEYMGGYSG
jgi:hypothetical protein